MMNIAEGKKPGISDKMYLAYFKARLGGYYCQSYFFRTPYRVKVAIKGIKTPTIYNTKDIITLAIWILFLQIKKNS